MSNKGFEVEDDKDTQEWSENTALNEFEALKKRLKDEAEKAKAEAAKNA